MVKWNNEFSSQITVTGGGPQGGTAAILEYISLTCGNLDFLEDDEKFKFVDDATFIEVLNLILAGLSSFNPKTQIPSDLSPDNLFLPTENTKSQEYLNRISEWTQQTQMKLNSDKTKYMIINFCKSTQFQTRLYLEKNPLEQVKQTNLLGVLIADDLTWKANTNVIIKKSYQRMTILRKLYEFEVHIKDLIQIYILYIRSLVEQACVVWTSSITQQEVYSIERVQKVALRIILKNKYESYENALKFTKLPTLSDRRTKLYLKFAKKCTKN